MRIARIVALTINAERHAHNARHAKQKAFHVERSETSRISDSSLRMNSVEKSRRGLVLFLANQGKLFAFYHRAIDRYFVDIFAACHVVHDVKHNAFEQRTQRTRAGAFGDSLRGE